MAYLSYEQVAATAVVKTMAALTIPDRAIKVELQADTNNVHYTMDDATDPTQTSGMVLGLFTKPELFLIQDLQNIRFVRGAAVDGNLNIHYLTGRDV